MRRAIPIISVLFLLACTQPEAQQTTLPLLPVAPVVIVPMTVAPQATTTSTTTSTTTTTTEVPLVPDVNDYIDETRAQYGRCGEWYETAVAAGWQLPTYWADLSRIMYRESRCIPTAFNGHDAGLTQLNKVHTAGMRTLGYTWPDDAFVPLINLRYAWILYRDACINQNGQRPWSYIKC
jgi:hypothetical protein